MPLEALPEGFSGLKLFFAIARKMKASSQMSVALRYSAPLRRGVEQEARGFVPGSRYWSLNVSKRLHARDPRDGQISCSQLLFQGSHGVAKVVSWSDVVPPVCQCLASMVQGDCPEYYECPSQKDSKGKKNVSKITHRL